LGEQTGALGWGRWQWHDTRPLGDESAKALGKTKSRLEAKAALCVEIVELNFSGMETLCTSPR
jgi:hypothetical protein